jgi:hypothetical protein
MKRSVAGVLALLTLCWSATDEGAMHQNIQNVKAENEARLFALPGVVSVGIGLDPAGGEVIVVGLDRARPATQERIPAELGGYPVRVEIIGTVRPR